MSEFKITFPSEAAAQAALENAGFSLGRIQRSDPRGVMFGEFDIAKWRNLSDNDKAGLHGRYQRHGGPGTPVDIFMWSDPGAPGEAIRTLEAGATSQS